MAISNKPPTGAQIATEVEREMALNLYELRSVTLAPGEFHVYLHPRDFALVEPVIARIALDLQVSLNALVTKLNRRSKWLGLLGRRYSRPPIEVPAGGWAVHIGPALNDELGPGELGIHSRLAVPARARIGSGAGTVRIAETVISGDQRKTAVTEHSEVAASEQMLERPAEPTASVMPRPVATGGPSLLYSDEAGSHVFMIAKDLTRIGRGGSAHWVDVSVVAGAQVSREHCRIRREPNGKFLLQDVSAWGTFVNGTKAPKYVEGRPDTEIELPYGATIRLADALTLEFALKAR